MITVVGMGNKSDDLTMLGAQTIQKAQVVVVKSQLTHMKKIGSFFLTEKIINMNFCHNSNN